MHRDISPTPDYSAAWIITLWRALHGNDSSTAEVAAYAIASLWRFLPACEASFGLQPLSSLPRAACACAVECADSGDYTTDTESRGEELEEMCNLQCFDPDDFSIHHYYFNFKGVFYCLDRPASACLPTAA
jgi:hypothetical protein